MFGEGNSSLERALNCPAIPLFHGRQDSVTTPQDGCLPFDPAQLPRYGASFSSGLRRLV